jgi:hypothetical protein
MSRTSRSISDSDPAAIRSAFALIAEVVVLHGAAYLPLFERLEREVAALDAKASAFDRARQVAATATRSNHDAFCSNDGPLP